MNVFIFLKDDVLHTEINPKEMNDDFKAWKISHKFLPFDSSNASSSGFDVFIGGYCRTEEDKLARIRNNRKVCLAYDPENGLIDAEAIEIASIMPALSSRDIFFRAGDTKCHFTSGYDTRIYSYERPVKLPKTFCRIYATIFFDGKPIELEPPKRIAASNGWLEFAFN